MQHHVANLEESGGGMGGGRGGSGGGGWGGTKRRNKNEKRKHETSGRRGGFIMNANLTASALLGSTLSRYVSAVTTKSERSSSFHHDRRYFLATEQSHTFSTHRRQETSTSLQGQATPLMNSVWLHDLHIR